MEAMAEQSRKTHEQLRMNTIIYADNTKALESNTMEIIALKGELRAFNQLVTAHQASKEKGTSEVTSREPAKNMRSVQSRLGSPVARAEQEKPSAVKERALVEHTKTIGSAPMQPEAQASLRANKPRSGAGETSKGALQVEKLKARPDIQITKTPRAALRPDTGYLPVTAPPPRSPSPSSYKLPREKRRRQSEVSFYEREDTQKRALQGAQKPTHESRKSGARSPVKPPKGGQVERDDHRIELTKPTYGSRKSASLGRAPK